MGASQRREPDDMSSGVNRHRRAAVHVRTLRRVSQVTFLLLFVALLLAALQGRTLFPLADAFFRADPLAALSAMVAARDWLPNMAFGLLTLAVTVALGRVWCGWICPLGTVLDGFRFRKARRRAEGLPPRLRSAKYGLLIVILVMAALGSLSLLVLDPIGLLTRTMTTAVVPAADGLVSRVESAAYHLGPLRGGADWFDAHVRGVVLPASHPSFTLGILMLLVFATVVLLNLFAHRFWCRYLCPLGALLGLFAKVALLRPKPSTACDGCARCASACRLGAIQADAAESGSARNGQANEEQGQSRPSPPPVSVDSCECTMCLDCLVACKRTDMRFGRSFAVSHRPYDPDRREILVAAALGVGAVVLLDRRQWTPRASTRLIRPPGARTEAEFLGHCIRCGGCQRVCPTGGLQPTLTEAGLEGLWTPTLVARRGYCDFACTACGHACPSGAIRPLSLVQKRRTIIGTAVLDRDRCLPWARNVPCSVCYEMCPLSKKAIKLTRGRMVSDANGVRNWLTYPVVVAPLCIGCGICEYQCPVAGAAAITTERITRLGPASSGSETG